MPDRLPKWLPGPSWWYLRQGMHYVMRVDVTADALRVAGLEPDALDKRTHAGLGLPHVHVTDGTMWDHPGGPGLANTILTASTAELQALLRTETKGIFDDRAEA